MSNLKILCLVLYYSTCYYYYLLLLLLLSLLLSSQQFLVCLLLYDFVTFSAYVTDVLEKKNFNSIQYCQNYLWTFNSIKNAGAHASNDIPLEIRSITTRKAFNKKLTKYYIFVLMTVYIIIIILFRLLVCLSSAVPHLAHSELKIT